MGCSGEQSRIDGYDLVIEGRNVHHLRLHQRFMLSHQYLDNIKERYTNSVIHNGAQCLYIVLRNLGFRVLEIKQFPGSSVLKVLFTT